MRFGISLPPVTQGVATALVTLSAAVALLRYNKYEELVAAAKLQPETDSRPLGRELPVFSNIAVPLITMEPGLVLSYPWTMLTTTFVELSLMPLAISLVCVLFGGRYLERAWGSREFAKFFLIQALIPNAVCFAVFALLFAFTKTGTYLYGVVNGCIALQTGFLVAFKQLVPEHSIMIFQGLFKAQVKYLAVPIAVGYSVVGLALGQWPKIFLSWSGFFTAWVYLRFYRVQYVESELPLSSNLAAARSERTSIRGDASDTFALAKFFYPALVSDAVSVISDIVYQLLVSLRICTPFSQDDVDASNLQASLRVRAATGASGFHDAEAERRRELARRALEERLRGAPGVTTAS